MFTMQAKRTICFSIVVLMSIGSACTGTSQTKKITRTGSAPADLGESEVRGLRWLSSLEVAASGYTRELGAKVDSTSGSDHPVDSMPRILDNGIPYYPEAASLGSISGTVWIKSLVDVDGTVLCSMVVKESGHPYSVGFERSALIAAMKNRYAPALRDGQPVKLWVTFPMEFKVH